jgi:peroxiredoxin
MPEQMAASHIVQVAPPHYMRGGHLMRSDIIPGAIFPDYSLPDHTGTVRTLSELQGRDPLILVLSRGHYCPKEHQQHLKLAAFQSKVAVAYTQMVTISTDEHHALQEFRASVGAQRTFLSDPGRTIQKDLDIQEYTKSGHWPWCGHHWVGHYLAPSDPWRHSPKPSQPWPPRTSTHSSE